MSCPGRFNGCTWPYKITLITSFGCPRGPGLLPDAIHHSPISPRGPRLLPDAIHHFPISIRDAPTGKARYAVHSDDVAHFAADQHLIPLSALLPPVHQHTRRVCSAPVIGRLFTRAVGRRTFEGGRFRPCRLAPQEELQQIAREASGSCIKANLASDHRYTVPSRAAASCEAMVSDDWQTQPTTGPELALSLPYRAVC